MALLGRNEEKMAAVNERECEKVGVSTDVVRRFALRFERLCRDANIYGISLFCGSVNSLRFDDGEEQKLILAFLTARNTDGGCGAACERDDGYIRGE